MYAPCTAYDPCEAQPCRTALVGRAVPSSCRAMPVPDSHRACTMTLRRASRSTLPSTSPTCGPAFGSPCHAHAVSAHESRAPVMSTVQHLPVPYCQLPMASHSANIPVCSQMWVEGDNISIVALTDALQIPVSPLATCLGSPACELHMQARFSRRPVLRVPTRQGLRPAAAARRSASCIWTAAARRAAATRIRWRPRSTTSCLRARPARSRACTCCTGQVTSGQVAGGCGWLRWRGCDARAGGQSMCLGLVWLGAGDGSPVMPAMALPARTTHANSATCLVCGPAAGRSLAGHYDIIYASH
jgi:hypothetical protein